MGLGTAIKTAGRMVLRPEARQDARHEWGRRLRGEPALPGPAPTRVLVVCHGNLCRSPYAAARLARRAPALEVRSGGLGAGGGDPADATARRVAAARGLSLEAHRTEVLDAEQVEWAELILAMEGRHVAAIARRWPGAEARTRVLGHFLPAPPYQIADPWGRPEACFHETFERIDRALERLLDLLEVRAA